MEKVIYKTLAECEAAINTLKVIGVTIPDWMVKQHKELKTAVNAKAVVTNTDTPIYDTLVANYPYGKMPEENEKKLRRKPNMETFREGACVSAGFAVTYTWFIR